VTGAQVENNDAAIDPEPFAARPIVLLDWSNKMNLIARIVPREIVGWHCAIASHFAMDRSISLQFAIAYNM
jgi:hypothetical protein